MVFHRLIHVDTCSSTSFIFIAEKNSIECLLHSELNLCILPLMKFKLFPLFLGGGVAFRNNGAMIPLVDVSLCTYTVL